MQSFRRSRAAGSRLAFVFALVLLFGLRAQAQTVCPSAPPALLAPSDGAAAVPSPVEFRWNAIPAGSAELLAYRVRVILPGGEEVVIAETKEAIAMAPLPAGTHSWFVEAVLAGCPSLFSAKNRFTVSEHACPGKGPALLVPADGATGIASPVTFSWGEVLGAPAYRLMISVAGAPFEPRVTQDRTATVLLPEKPIEWFVDTAPEGCPPVASPVFHFTVSGTPSCPSTPPQLAIPPDGASISQGPMDPPLELVWTAIPEAVSYTLELTVSGNQLTIAGLKQPIFVAGGPVDLRNTSVEWFVRAVFEGCPPVESAHRRFTVTTPAACALAPPAPVAPTLGSKTFSPVTHFIWSASPGAAEYRLWVSPDGREPRVAAVTQGALETEIVLEFGAIDWFVEAFREGCPPARSEPSRFTIERSAECDAPPPRGVRPAPGDTNLTSPVQFSWEGAKGAVGYNVWLSNQGGRPTPLFDPSHPGELITGTSLTAEVPPGESVWFVEAIFSGCPPAASAPAPFIVSGCDVQPPFLANPRAGARVSPPVDLLWTPVKGAASYEVFISRDGGAPESLGTRTAPGLLANPSSGGIVWWVIATVEGCAKVRSAESAFVVGDAPACGTPARPNLGAPGQVSSKNPYRIRWDSVPNAGSYEVEESLTPDFTSATKVKPSTPEAEFSHDVATDTAYYYRVRASSSCNSETSEPSAAARVVVLGPSSSRAPAATADAGSYEPLLKSIFIQGGSSAGTYRARSNTPWISLPVTSGTIPVEGLTLALTADPSALPLGTNQGEITVELFGSGAGKDGERRSQDGTPTVTVPVSLTLVTPVTKGGKSAPPPEALIIPAVIHSPGALGANFRSDVRVFNALAQATQVQVSFTPTASDGTASGARTSLSINAGETIALDAVLKQWFGLAALGEAVSGSLEIRPLSVGTTSSGPLSAKKTLAIIGSSRTYNEASTGTFGQFIPAIPFRDFVGGPKTAGATSTTLSIQQIAHSSSYRTNLGIVEGAGESADVAVSAYDGDGKLQSSFTKSLKPGEHMQLNSVLQGLTLDDGRFEIAVTSNTGKVFAYASVVDNQTNDPMLIHAVNLDDASTDHQVLAGVADLDTGIASWRTDVRLYNAEKTSIAATLTFYPTLDPASSKSIQVTLQPGEIEQLDNVLASHFGLTNVGGVIHVTTQAAAKLVASARTYNETTSGTYGQFVPAFREEDGIAKGDPPLQILQLELSKGYRTNIGLFEMSGKAATVELTAVIPESRVTPKLSVPLQAYEFTQLVGALKSMGLDPAYNARVSIRVKDGEGTVAAYASVVDNTTQDPIYVPSQQ